MTDYEWLETYGKTIDILSDGSVYLLFWVKSTDGSREAFLQALEGGSIAEVIAEARKHPNLYPRNKK